MIFEPSYYPLIISALHCAQQMQHFGPDSLYYFLFLSFSYIRYIRKKQKGIGRGYRGNEVLHLLRAHIAASSVTA